LLTPKFLESATYKLNVLCGELSFSHGMAQIFTEEKPVEQKRFLRNSFYVLLRFLWPYIVPGDAVAS
jgi:hypothetical protein